MTRRARAGVATRLTLLLLVLLGTVGCDQVTKSLATRVVDFMVLGIGPVQTGVFNVADLGITIGAGLLLLDRVSGREGRHHVLGEERERAKRL